MENVVEVTDVAVLEEISTTQIVPSTPSENMLESMEKMVGMSQMLAKSTIVPQSFQNRPENVLVALDMANRMGVSPMMIMQNLYVIQGKPSFSGQACTALLRNSKEFRDIELVYVGKENTDDWGSYVTAIRNRDGKVVKSATVTIGIAKKEGWFQKTGSKWQTMPELMLGYRAYTWFVRTHCPELLMGLQTADEVEDISAPKVEDINLNPFDKKEK